MRADLEIRTIYLPPKGTAPIRFDGFAGDLLARESANEVALNPVDGRVVSAARARDLSPFFRWVESADFLHTGRWGGLVTRIAWFFFGAATASMSLTGVYLQVKKQARDHRRMPRAAVAISYACVLLILTISIQGAFSEIRSYGAYLGDRQSFPDIALGVRGFIAAWTLTLIVPLLLWARWVR